jgi:L-2-hydroxyglutarate oxidase LhgO
MALSFKGTRSVCVLTFAWQPGAGRCPARLLDDTAAQADEGITVQVGRRRIYARAARPSSFRHRLERGAAGVTIRAHESGEKARRQPAPPRTRKAMTDVGLTVVGAGVVGLAVAARLAPRFPGLLIVERRERHGQETSSRNSEVIHAGMYYPTGSLKARLCVEGNRRLYEIAAAHDVPHRRVGKLIVAMSGEERPALETLFARGRDNGVELRLLTGAQARALEPRVEAVAALESPRTGIVSAHALMDHFLQAARAHGAELLPRAEVTGVERRGDGYALTLRTPDGVETLVSERVVNAAGLESDTLAALCGIDVDAAGYRLHWCQGSYFSVPPARAALVSRLVYPVPGLHSLGTHAVLDLAGRLRFGPDVEYLDERRLDYRVDARRRASFGASVRHLLPQIADDELEPDISGIRPKLQAPGQPVRDFVIAEESARGLPGWVNLVGIESPGLTAAPAIARVVDELLA